MTVARAGWPSPADFGTVPSAADIARWEDADRAARPARLARLRERFADAGIDAYYGVRREHMRYLTGFTLAEGEERAAGSSGQFLVGGDDVVVFADSRYTIQARREAPESRLEAVYGDLPSHWPDLVGSIGARRVGVEAGFVPHAVWGRLAAAAPNVELVPVEGWVEGDRATKEPSEIERIAAACAVADRALATLLPEIVPGATEAALALRLEWLDPHRRRRGAGLRRGLSVRSGGGVAARRPGRPTRARWRGAAVRLRGAGRRLPERHDADAVRG